MFLNNIIFLQKTYALIAGPFCQRTNLKIICRVPLDNPGQIAKIRAFANRRLIFSNIFLFFKIENMTLRPRNATQEAFCKGALDYATNIKDLGYFGEDCFRNHRHQNSTQTRILRKSLVKQGIIWPVFLIWFRSIILNNNINKISVRFQFFCMISPTRKRCHKLSD